PPPREGGDATPLVTVLVVAHDEGARIGARIENLLALDYPPERLEILVASDGSADATVAEARRHEPAGVGVVAFEGRRGKPAVLNDLVPKARGELVVLADARQRFEAGAIRALVAPFADPEVGAVSGELMLDDGGGRPGGGLLLACGEGHPPRRGRRGLHGGRPRRGVPHPPRPVPADPRGHHPRRRADPARDRPAGLPGPVRARRPRPRPGGAGRR